MAELNSGSLGRNLAAICRIKRVTRHAGLGPAERVAAGASGPLFHQHEEPHGAQVCLPHDPGGTQVQQGGPGEARVTCHTPTNLSEGALL